MCLSTRREYTVGATAAAGAFAAAAVLDTLGPADALVAEQVDHAVTELVADLRRHLIARGTRTSVEVIVHANHIEIVVAADSPTWSAESVRVRPRQPFATTVACATHRAEPPLPRPRLWPSLSQVSDPVDWLEVYSALNAIMQMPRGARLPLRPTLDAVADAIVVTTCFPIVAINLVRPDGDLEVVSVTGPPDCVGTLLGQVERRADWDELIERSEAWGTLRYAPGDAPLPSNTVMTSWMTTRPKPVPGGGWDADATLFAPLYNAGRLVGAINTDLPGGSAWPSADDLRKLELYAEHVGEIVDHARSPYLVWVEDE